MTAFYVLKLKGYNFKGYLFPFKGKRSKKVTMYSINRHLNVAEQEKEKFKKFCDSIEIIPTNTITKEMFLKQTSSCGIFKGCEAKIKHDCKDDYPIHLWYDPSNEGVGFFCEDAIREAVKKYPYTMIISKEA